MTLTNWFPRLFKRRELLEAPTAIPVETDEDWLAEFVIRNNPKLQNEIPFIMVLAQAYHRRKINKGA